jgi:hypothetical protein
MRLPVSDLDVSFRLPDGHDDLAILEPGGASRSTSTERALDALCRLGTLSPTASPSGDQSQAVFNPSPWLCLTVTDFEFALLSLRGFLFGDTVRTLVRCTCSERMEMEFSIAPLLREAQPRTPSGVVPSSVRVGWYILPGKLISFRLPTVSDQIEALASSFPYAQLVQCCIERSIDAGQSDEAGRPDMQPGVRSTAAAERAMEAMAPTLSRPISGACAVCGASMTLQLHVPSLVLNEIHSSAVGVHSEIHAIAANYHWPEAAILALPQVRRQAYTEAIRNGGTL